MVAAVDGYQRLLTGEGAALTVAIPSWNRHALLAETLASLAFLYWATPLDVIVIDDGSEPPYHPEALLTVPPRWSLTVLRTEGIGANAARNLAMETAQTEWVAILDDDVYVLPGWLDAMVEAQNRAGVLAVAGRITVKYEAAPPEWLGGSFFHGYLSMCDLGEAPQLGGVIPVSANCALSTTMWREVGGFFAGVDRKGASLVSGGETEFFLEAERRGMKILYEPRAAVLHRFGADRLTLDYFERRAFGQGCTDAILRGGPGDLVSEARTIGRSLKFNAIAEVNRLTHRRTSIPDRVWRQYARGWLSGALRHRDTRRQLSRLRHDRHSVQLEVEPDRAAAEPSAAA